MHSAPDPGIPFPFEPYPAQKALMARMYDTLEKGHIGLFESPTGTGKSLSLICTALHWLREREKADDAGIAAPKSSSPRVGSSSSTSTTREEPDWLRDHTASKQLKEQEQRRQRVRERKAALLARLQSARDSSHRLSAVRKENAEPPPRTTQRVKSSTGGSQRNTQAAADGKEDDGYHDHEAASAEFLLDEYLSADEAGGGGESEEEHEAKGGGTKDDADGEELDRTARKILYCSRTHSQVSQFVMEIKKTAFKEDARVMTLGSRRNLCINEEVLRLRTDTRINDRCLDMQKGKLKAVSTKEADKGSVKRQRVQNTKKTKKCPYLQGTEAAQGVYRDHALSRIRNLEDLADLGGRLGVCPYYGTRSAVAQAEIIAMPYTTLIHKDSRESMRIPLKGNIVLIDEAHNLIEAINAIYTSTISLPQLARALSQVTLYWQRYKDRLSGKNAAYVKQVIRVVQGLVDFVRKEAGATSRGPMTTPAAAPHAPPRVDPLVDSRVIPVNDLLFEAGIDHINLFKLQRYMDVSQIAKKVLGFSEALLPEVQTHSVMSRRESHEQGEHGDDDTAPSTEPEAEYVSNHVSSLQIVQTFLKALTSANKDGRIVVQRGGRTERGGRRSHPGLKFIQLNAALPFREIVAEAHAVVLVGGTLSPVAGIISQLLPYVEPSRIDVFSCGHVMPPENLTALCMARGPGRIEFDFTHKSRGEHAQLDELGRLLLNICTTVPAGVVCFLPSFQYEETVFKRWRESGLLSKLEGKKAVFREPKAVTEVESLLHAYASSVQDAVAAAAAAQQEGAGRKGGGAVLFCVVGAKMSEGINFSDDLCRCVVMVGLPYPDKRDPELQQKLQFIDNLRMQGKASTNTPFGGVSGQSYYQTLCMRAVNQCIGRAIRHAGDYAAIVLVDRRYETDSSIRALLPGWVSSRLVPREVAPDFGKAFACINRFFKSKAQASLMVKWCGGPKPDTVWYSQQTQSGQAAAVTRSSRHDVR